MNENSCLPKQHQLETSECEEVTAWSKAVGWKENEYHQVGRGPFDAWFDVSLCDDLRVVNQYFSRELVASGIAPKNRVALLVPQNRGDRGIVNGKELKKNEALVMGEGAVAFYRTPPDCRLLGLHLPVDRLREVFEATCDQELDPLVRETRVIQLPDTLSNQFAWIANQVIAAAPGHRSDPTPVVWQQELETNFVASLLSGLTTVDERMPGALARTNRVQYVRAAQDYIEEHLSDPLDLSVLARVTGISPRTLEYAFRQVCDTTPLQYIKLRRLSAARQRLLDTLDPAVTVSRIALENGLGHFGYFARDYYSLFGEYPSETLARQFV